MTYTSTGWQVQQGVKKEKGKIKSEANFNLTWLIQVDRRKQNLVCVGDVQMGFGSLTWASSFAHRNIHLGVLTFGPRWF